MGKTARKSDGHSALPADFAATETLPEPPVAARAGCAAACSCFAYRSEDTTLFGSWAKLRAKATVTPRFPPILPLPKHYLSHLLPPEQVAPLLVHVLRIDRKTPRSSDLGQNCAQKRRSLRASRRFCRYRNIT